MFVYTLCIIFIIGLVLGSFGNAWAYRLVNDEDISKGRSHCPRCGHVLGAFDLFPLFSYIFLRGKCRYCREKISIRYPLAEAVTGLVFVTLFVRYGFSLQTLFLCGFGFFLMVLSFADWESLIIPSKPLWCSFICVLAARFFRGALWSSSDWKADVINLFSSQGFFSGTPAAFSPGEGLKYLLMGALTGLGFGTAILAIVLIMDRLLKKETMGGGDIKLIFVCTSLFGVIQGMFFLLLACIIGLILAVLPGASGRDGEDAQIFPFGPALCISAWLTALIGDAVLKWYMGFF